MESNNWEQRLEKNYRGLAFGKLEDGIHQLNYQQLKSFISLELEKAREEVKKVFQEEEAFILAQAHEEGRQEGMVQGVKDAFEYDDKFVADVIRQEERQRLLGLIEEMVAPGKDETFDDGFFASLEALKEKI